MSKWIQVDVTVHDIRAGKPGCEMCPVARAVRRVFRQAEYIAVEAGEIVVDEARMDMPPTVSQFVDDFDWTQSGKPFSFKMPPRFRKLHSATGAKR